MADFYDDDDENLKECSICGNLNHPEETECGYCGEALGGQYHVYIPKKFNAEHTRIIELAHAMLLDYAKQGYNPTLRQIYYQFVKANHIQNKQAEYKRLGGIINDARLAGLLSFEHISDLERPCRESYSQPDPESALENIQYSYKENMWADQDAYVECWVEKKALLNVVERPCGAFDVPHMGCKGYMSSSALWAAGNRFVAAQAQDKHCVLIHLGDHDPSGLDMTRDNGARLRMFAGRDVEVRRIALNMDQIDFYGPPPNPAKTTDSRSSDYIRKYGHDSWELDALTPEVIDKLIRTEIRKWIDLDVWNETLERQAEEREFLQKVSRNSSKVFEYVRSLP